MWCCHVSAEVHEAHRPCTNRLRIPRGLVTQPDDTECESKHLDLSAWQSEEGHSEAHRGDGPEPSCYSCQPIVVAI
jgi:hypothetical protein